LRDIATKSASRQRVIALPRLGTMISRLRKYDTSNGLMSSPCARQSASASGTSGRSMKP
jgi:hypothetical protein